MEDDDYYVSVSMLGTVVNIGGYAIIDPYAGGAFMFRGAAEKAIEDERANKEEK